MKRGKIKEKSRTSVSEMEVAPEVALPVNEISSLSPEYTEVGTVSISITVNEVKKDELHSPLVYHPEEGVFSPLVYQLKGVPLGKDFMRTPYAKCLDTFKKNLTDITSEIKPQERKNLFDTISKLANCFNNQGLSWISLMPILTSPPRTSIKTVVEVEDVSFFDPAHPLKNKTRNRYEGLRHIITSSVIDREVLKDPEFIHNVTPLVKRLTDTFNKPNSDEPDNNSIAQASTVSRGVYNL